MGERELTDIRIDADKLLEREGGQRHPMVVEAARWAAETTERLASPGSTHRLRPVECLDDQVIEIDGLKLHVGPNARLLRDAQEVLVGVCTIGPALDQEIRRNQEQGNLLEAYFLGKAGFVALDAVASVLNSVAEDAAANRGWGVGAVLSPGSLPGWEWQEQRKLCLLVDARDAGVQVSETGLLKPRYTLSMLIGIGQGYESHSVGSGCNYCSLKNSCQYRPTS